MPVRRRVTTPAQSYQHVSQTAYVIIPIASNSDEHIGILSALASTLADKTKSAKLRTVTSVDEVLDLLTPEEEE